MVLGAGAIGAYYGGQLARAGHDVTLYARGDNLAAIRRRGLEIRTPEGSTLVKVAATDRADDLAAADFAILGVKSYSLESIGPVARRVAERGAAILPFLNGVETTDHLLALGVSRGALLGGVTRISVARVQPGVVERRGPMQSVIIGELDGQTTDRVTRIAAAFRDAGADARVSNRIDVDLWHKFLFLPAGNESEFPTRSRVGRPNRAGRSKRRRFAVCRRGGNFGAYSRRSDRRSGLTIKASVERSRRTLCTLHQTRPSGTSLRAR